MKGIVYRHYGSPDVLHYSPHDRAAKNQRRPYREPTWLGPVEAVGRNATRFQPGDPVFGGVRGAFAEYVCAPENRLALKPANLTYAQAAAVPMAGVTALQGLRDKGRVQPGQKVRKDMLEGKS